MASSSYEYQDNDQEYGSSKVKITILASEWGSSKGGLSTINRELAIQLAKSSRVEITFFVPHCNDDDEKEALCHNVHVLKAARLAGYEELEWLSSPPKDLQIDIIVGHGVKLGRQAQIIRNFHKCKWFQVIHTDPEELGMYKSYPNPISTGEQKHSVEVELCELADFVVGVGPKLSEAFRAYLRWCKKDQRIFDLTPGLFEEFTSVKQAPEERKHRSVLVFGRGDAEDFELKGFDIAGRAVASLPDSHLVFYGAPDGKLGEVAQRFLDCDVPANRLRVRSYGKSRESLKRLFYEVDLVLMPSRTEGFGLTGLEALSAGLPVLVSKNSGFGEALTKVPFGSSFVIDSEDPKIWAAAIKKIWEKDRRNRLEEAEALRTSYDRKYSWTKQSDALLLKMINLVRAFLRVKIGCEAMKGPGAQKTATGMVVKPQEPHPSVQGDAAVPPNMSNQPEEAHPSSGIRNRSIPSVNELFRKIADKYFEELNPSKPEEFNGYLQYLKEVRKVLFVGVETGSLILTVEIRSVKILEDLWRDFRTGHLNDMAQKFLVTEDVLQQFGLTEVRLTTTIAVDEYLACLDFLKHLIRVRLDCETITGPGIQGGATGTVVTSPRPDEVVQGSTASNILNHQQGVDMTALTRQKVRSGCMLSGTQVLHFIEHKYFQTADPVNPEERNAFLKYLTGVGKLLFTMAEEGGLIVTLECRSLLIVDQLWEDYFTGRLNEMVQKFLVTDEILKPLGLVHVKLVTHLAEEEYRECRWHFLYRSFARSPIVRSESYEVYAAHTEGDTRGGGIELVIHVLGSFDIYLALAVDRSDSIKKLKTKIEEKFKIPPDKQHLHLSLKDLEDDHTLSDYNIRDGYVLYLAVTSEIVIEIGIRTLTGAMITLAVKPFDRIEAVKKQIERKEGIPPDQQRLVFGDRILDNHHDLHHYSIRHKSIVHMAMEIFIKPLSGKKIVVNVPPSDTVRTLKRKRETVEGLPLGKKPTLAYDGRQLDDDATLAKCTIQTGSTLCEVDIDEVDEPLRHVLHFSFSFSLKIRGALAALLSKQPELVERATRSALEAPGIQLQSISVGSVLVTLGCSSRLRFLTFLLEFEKQEAQERLKEELRSIGFNEELNASITNRGEVDQTFDEIRSSFYTTEKESELVEAFAVYLPQEKTKFNVEIPTGKKIILESKSSDTIKMVKDQIEATEGIPSHKQILEFDGERMENSRRLSFYNIQPKSTVALIKNVNPRTAPGSKEKTPAKKRDVGDDLIRVRLDCETTTGPGIQGGATGTVVTSPRPEEVVQGSTESNTLNQQQGVDMTALTGQKGGSGCVLSGTKVLHFIEHKYFQTADLVNPEERNAFLKYLTEKGKLLFTIAEEDGLIVTLECRSLLLVDQLWEDYFTGRLNEMVQKFLVTEEILKPLGLVDVKLVVYIEEEEYRGCRSHFWCRSEARTSKETSKRYEVSPAHAEGDTRAGGIEVVIHIVGSFGYHLALAADRSDSIKKLKAKIEETFKTPPDEQLLHLSGEILDDDHTLSDYNILDGYMLDVTVTSEIVIEIGIRTLTGAMITLAVKPFDRIEAVKKQIERLEGIPLHQQRLVFGDSILDDEEVLRFCSIRHKSIVDIAMEIFIKSLSGRKIVLAVLPSDTVRTVKRKRETVEGFPLGKKPTLAYDGRQLDDDATLAQCSIQTGSTLCEVDIDEAEEPLRHALHFSFSFSLKISGALAALLSKEPELVAKAARSALEAPGIQLQSISVGSVLVALQCISRQRFLSFLLEFEKQEAQERLKEELRSIGFKEELNASITNRGEVEETFDEIRSSFYTTEKESELVEAFAVYLPREKTKFNVEMPTGKKIILESKSSDTIKMVKDQIETTEGIPSLNQVLEFDGRKMENSRRLSFYNIQPKLTVQLIERDMEIFVTRMIDRSEMVYLAREKTKRRREEIILKVKSSDTIKMVKDQIEAIEGIPSDEQVLEFDGKKMKNSRLLSFYKIQPKSIVQLKTLWQE